MNCCVSPRRVLLADTVILVAILVGFAGCATPKLMATPNLYLRGDSNPFERVPDSLRHNKVTVLFASDRVPIASESGETTYGFDRSTSLAFGLAQVEFGEGVPWDVLEENSLKRVREADLRPYLRNVDEFTRLPPSNERLEAVDGRINVRQTVLDEENAGWNKLHGRIREALLHTDRKEIFLFIHGYNASFESSIFTSAQVWHFLGRIGVPASYSWPAGHGGIRGYTADRESGEFTIYHLKQFIRALAACPDLQQLNIIAHSRGTDVALTAIRELHIECTAAGQSTREKLKLGNVILAAPDLDFEVVTQRVGAEGLFTVPRRMTIYISPEDKAIGVSSWLFDSLRRIGRLRLTDLTVFQRKSMQGIPDLEIVDARTRRADPFGHSYFYQSPAVRSDLILILRDDCSAGAENRRPLARDGESFWMLTDDYPQFSSDVKDSSR